MKILLWNYWALLEGLGARLLGRVVACLLFTFSFLPHVCCHPSTSLADLEILINSTIVSLAATVRTDPDRTVVIAALESTGDLFRSLKSTSFVLTGKALESLMVSIQDILECKVRSALCYSSLWFVVIFFLFSFTGPMSGRHWWRRRISWKWWNGSKISYQHLALSPLSFHYSLCYFPTLVSLSPKGWIWQHGIRVCRKFDSSHSLCDRRRSISSLVRTTATIPHWKTGMTVS